MSLILCTDPCVYQKDGYCFLSRASSAGAPEHGGCVNFVPVQPEGSQQCGQSIADIGNADHFQAGGDDQFPLGPLGDQAFGKS